MVNPFTPVYCVRCKRPVTEEESLCEECRQQETHVRAEPARPAPVPTAPRWSPVRRLLLLLFVAQFLWLGWTYLRGLNLFASVDLVDVALLVFDLAVIAPFGLVAVDLWQDEDRFTLYGYAAAGWQLFWSVEALIRLREVEHPLQHNGLSILEAVLSGALLLTLWLYRSAERKTGYEV